jgi:hypothetical protein
VHRTRVLLIRGERHEEREKKKPCISGGKNTISNTNTENRVTTHLSDHDKLISSRSWSVYVQKKQAKLEVRESGFVR